MMEKSSRYTHLCFVYIPKYKGINDVEIVVDPHYICHYDKHSKHLSIEKNTRIPDSFWCDRIHSVAAIVGNNGVGKSTAVEFILQGIVEGADSKDVDGIFVYECEEKLSVYSKESISLPSGVTRIKEFMSICCLYYSGHFILDSADNLRCRELAGNYNISDGFLLIKDVQNYANIDSTRNSLSLYDHLALYKALNHIRICRMISDRVFSDVMSEFLSLKYILVNINTSGLYALKEYERFVKLSILNEPTVPLIQVKHKDDIERTLSKYIYFNYLNILFNESHTQIDNGVLQSLIDWQSFYNGTNPVLNQFNDFIKKRVTDTALSSKLSLVYFALSKLNELASFHSLPMGEGFFYFEIASDLGKIRELADLMDKSPYLVSRYFDIAYAQDLNTDTVLSSGEQGLLDLVSRLYYTITKDCAKFCNLSAPALLILDEAEHSFHPDWQRRYLNLLFTIIQRLNTERTFKFQILITTHSPLLLSDIPIDCITFLYRGDDRVSRTIHPNFHETFAANVFDMYRHSFFLDKGMIGAFAANKLSELGDRIQHADKLGDREYHDLLREIDLIGDVRIRCYLQSGLSRKRGNDEISYHMARIEELKKEVK